MDIPVDRGSRDGAYSDLTLHRMVKEIDCVATRLDPGVRAEWALKRLRFFSYELHVDAPANTSPRQACEALNHFFFHKNGFAPVTISASDSSFLGSRAGNSASSSAGRSADSSVGSSLANSASSSRDPHADLAAAYLPHKVLRNRSGAPAALALIYSYLASQIGLPLGLIDLRPACFLKFVEDGVPRFIDICRRGRILTSAEFLESLHLRFDLPSAQASALLKAVPGQRFVNDYLSALKGAYLSQGAHDSALIVQNALIDQQPSAVRLFGERALLHRQLGDLKNALIDLKRYFVFHERSAAPPELVRVYDELRARLEKSTKAPKLDH